MEILKDISPYLDSIPDELFYSRNDPNDIRFGDIALRDFKDYAKADIVIVGCPDDTGVQRNKGRPGARFAPNEIRSQLYRFPVSSEHENISLFDLGNIKIEDQLEKTHKNLHSVVKRLFDDGKKVVAVGGGNDISYPDCSAVASTEKKLLVFNIDKHLDVRLDSQITSGTPYRKLLDENIIEPDLFFEIGINSFWNSRSYIQYIEDIGAHILYLGEIRKIGIGPVINNILQESQAEHVFWGFDLDVVRSSEAPGVSDPGPMGFTASEICEIADAAAHDQRTRIIEISEVNPVYDVDNMTSKLAANIIVRALAGNH
ncbi:formimidoylglutamase [candidate division KSB1 bacterium]